MNRIFCFLGFHKRIYMESVYQFEFNGWMCEFCLAKKGEYNQ